MRGRKLARGLALYLSAAAAKYTFGRETARPIYVLQADFHKEKKLLLASSSFTHWLPAPSSLPVKYRGSMTAKCVCRHKIIIIVCLQFLFHFAGCSGAECLFFFVRLASISHRHNYGIVLFWSVFTTPSPASPPPQHHYMLSLHG